MLNERQKEIITGSLLGDGTIWTNFIDPLMKLQIGQSKLDKEKFDKSSYICWYVKEFINIGCSVRLMSIKAAGLAANKDSEKYFDRYVFCSKCSLDWNELASKWYIPRTDHPRFKRRKIIPQDIKLTPLSLCIWHMDDGYNSQKDANIELNTQGFTIEEVDFLIEKLKSDLGIKSHKKSCGRNDLQKKIFIGRKYYFDFMDMIKPHIEWNCFKYKTETGSYSKKPNRGETSPVALLTDQQVIEIFKLRDEGMLQKDISELMGVKSVCTILSGKRWAHLGMSRPKRKVRSKLNEIEKKSILDLREKGYNSNQISRELDINVATVYRVIKGATCHA
jgi:hypothetical protein